MDWRSEMAQNVAVAPSWLRYEAEGTSNMNEVLDTVPCKVTHEMNNRLLSPYTEREVKDALFQMFPTKAPGPDGLPAHFYQKHWDLCGKEVTSAVLNVLNGGESPEQINQTVLVLIPKVPHPSTLAQFRPISLCNVILKIVSKAQANRLKEILPEIISEEQSAFVPGRLITDNIIAAYECLHFMKVKRPRDKQFCALKLDMMKAYDRIEWNYLEGIMLRLGFNHQWVSSIMRVVSTVTFSVLFNGHRLENFKPTRGIRQGDPISPYLFLLAAEGLSCLLRSRGISENLVGIQVAPTAPPVNHLLFADDSLLFFKANIGAAVEVNNALQSYCQASGQRVNLNKSSIHFGKGCPDQIRGDMKSVLQVSNESLSEKYLGMPTDVGKSITDAFKYIKDRIWKNVLGWIEQILSAGGKGVLIKSVLQAIPTFAMSLFKLPRGLCEHINSIIRGFWWGSKEGKKKPHWVSWEAMTRPQQDGGLGFRDMELFNLALLARQAWRVLTKSETLSAKILKSVYFAGGEFLSAELGSRPSQIWRSICEGRDVLKLGLIKRIGTGHNTRIWSDNWLPRDTRLRPITARTDEPPIFVSQLIDHASRSWNLQSLTTHFLRMDVEVIRSIPLGTTSHADFWAWNFEKKGLFFVRSAYRMLVKTKADREAWLDGRASSSASNEQKSWTSLWKTKVPSKIRVFLWRLSHQSLPTGNVLHRRSMADSCACAICNEPVDSWRHSLLDCNMARSTWALLDEELVEHMAANNCGNAKDWLFFLIETLSHEDFVRATVTLWAIWTARRKAIHEQIFQSPLTIFGFVNSFLADLKIAYEVTDPASSNNQRRPTQPSVTWAAPPRGFCKINVDAAISKTVIAGAVGAICRDENGMFLGASTRVIEGINDPPTLEALACSEGFSLAADLYISKFVVSTDCLGVSREINEGSSSSYATILKEIEVKRSAFSETFVIHENRKKNLEAHRLARGSVSLQPGRHVWLGSSPDLVLVPHNILAE